ncbi:polysaccharide biosynthesis/export family protein [Pontibacter ruber]|uniref:Polysaccharide biosynthesis/export family protein n=2 Tax=Pontibacter ruber TaxID=1343895 RepID=A0ABW5CSS7_9BACT
MSKRELVYLQNRNFKDQVPTQITNTYKSYTLQPNDVLSVKVQSVQPEMSNIFNIIDPANAFGISDPGSMYLSGYSVDQEGNITLPTVGKLKVAGMTTAQTQDLIQRNLDKYVSNATVIVKLISFRISVLGEVRNPGHFFVYNERANLLEGLSLAGDLTTGGSRQNVKLIRQKPEGSEVVLLDLTDPKIVQSPYYYLMPGDVLYVEPSKKQVRRDNLVGLSVATVALTAISTAVLLLNYFE